MAKAPTNIQMHICAGNCIKDEHLTELRRGEPQSWILGRVPWVSFLTQSPTFYRRGCYGSSPLAWGCCGGTTAGLRLKDGKTNTHTQTCGTKCSLWSCYQRVNFFKGTRNHFPNRIMCLLEQMSVGSCYLKIKVRKNEEEGTKLLSVSVGISLMIWLLAAQTLYNLQETTKMRIFEFSHVFTQVKHTQLVSGTVAVVAFVSD